LTKQAAKYTSWLPTLLSPAALSAVIFAIAGLLCLWQCRDAPIGDFGNYYYGSKLWLDHRFGLEDYHSIWHFNTQIRSFGETRFFLNYTPVPPFSLLCYAPFVFMKAAVAKFVFNVLGLSVFVFTWFRFAQWVMPESRWLIVVPFICYMPLYNNMLQGQTYLFISAALMNFFLAAEKHKTLQASAWMTLAISLKLFPVFFLLYVLLRGRYRIVFYSLLFSAAAYLLGGWVAGPGVLRYYSFEVLPRLFQNDIVGAFYSGNQSVYTLLLDLFTQDSLGNPKVIFHAPWLVPVLEGLIGGFLLAVLISFRKAPHALLFGLSALVALLVGRYQTSYGLMLLLPFVPLCCLKVSRSVWTLFYLFLLAIAMSWPVGQFLGSPLLLRYGRLWCLLLLFVTYVFYQRLWPNYRITFASIVLLITVRWLSYQPRSVRYVEIQNTKGILYDYQIQEDSLTLFSTLGEKDLSETIYFPVTWRVDTMLSVKDGILYCGENILDDGPGQKKKPIVVSDSLVLFMNDRNQGIGFYKLTCVPLKK